MSDPLDPVVTANTIPTATRTHRDTKMPIIAGEVDFVAGAADFHGATMDEAELA